MLRRNGVPASPQRKTSMLGTVFRIAVIALTAAVLIMALFSLQLLDHTDTSKASPSVLQLARNTTGLVSAINLTAWVSLSPELAVDPRTVFQVSQPQMVVSSEVRPTLREPLTPNITIPTYVPRTSAPGTCTLGDAEEPAPVGPSIPLCDEDALASSPGGADWCNELGFRIREDNLDYVLSRLATPQRDIIFTTGLFSSESYLQWVKTFLWHLRNVGVENVLLIGVTPESCRLAWRHGIRCFIDDTQWMVKRCEVATRVVAVDTKWYFLKLMIERGYNAIFSDLDVAFLQNPFQHWNRTADYAALSDYKIPNRPPLPKYVHTYCNPYHHADVPCQSTGLMFVMSNPRSLRILDLMLYHMEELNTMWWEQELWNQVLERRQIWPPIRNRVYVLKPEELLVYNLLDDNLYVNDYLRLQMTLPPNRTPVPSRWKSCRCLGPLPELAGFVALHLGYTHGPEKQQTFVNLGLWHGDECTG
eukprot:jgi/Chlat1/7688/Chrsp64S07143